VRPLRAAGSTVSAVALTLASLGCGANREPVPAEGSTTPTGTVTVLAAASLTEVFTQLGGQFETAHPGTTVTFSFGSSATLATQVLAGAPADVFAAASAATMRGVTDAGAADEPVDVATNTLQIAVPPGNAGGVTGLADLADPALRVALCAEQVPCGAAARQLFAAAGVTPAPDTLESDVKAVLQKVAADEVDAGLVYSTDVLAAGSRVEGIPVPGADAAANRYPVAVLRESRNPVTARAFVAFVLSPPGRRALQQAGFGSP
jgi:molybdate transport system substrate-binding protein